MPRLVIHSGFQKTGTTSLQNTLRDNQDKLEKWLWILPKEDLKNIRLAVQLFSISDDQDTLALLQEATREVLSRIDPEDPRDIVLSEEDLSGVMPGRHDKITYGATGAILKTIADEFARAQLPHHDLEVLITLRQTRPWAISCYSQHLRSTSLTMDLDQYLKTPAATCDLAACAADVVTMLAPIAVHRVWLEDLSLARLGPAQAVLAALPHLREQFDTINPSGIANTGLPDALAQTFLALNRQNLDPMELKQQKLIARRKYWRKRREG